jgi:TonB-linked SusC/RagA family outer membrane protein
MLAVPAIAHAQQGTITGRVVAAGTNEPLVEARVTVVNTTSVAATTAEGRYTLRVAPGTYVVRVIRVGFTEQKKSVTVAAGASVTTDFVLDQAIVKLTEVVTTATGEQRKVELGNTVAVIDASKKVAETPINSMNDLLTAHAPGVSVLPQAMTGSAAQIRIRGLNSATRGNAPIFIIDGIRMDASTGFSTGGTSSSRLNDVTPEEIENIEIVKGPSAATLYGTDAANGVIVITTKKGRPGNTRWTWTAEQGSVQDHNAYPFTWAEWGHLTTGNNTAQIARCLNTTVADGSCKVDSVTNSHMLRDKRFSPISSGKRSLYGAQISGGSDVLHFFVSGNLENEFGPIKMPGLDVHYLDSTLVGVRGEWMNPEAIQRENFRANLSGSFSPKLDMQIQTSFMKSDQRLPQVDNNVNSFYYNGYTNQGHNYIVSGTNGLNYSGISVGPVGEPLHGWAQYTPADIFQRTALEGIQRFIGGSTMAWRPLAWLQADGTVGVDFQADNQFSLQRLNEGPNFSTQRQGTITDNHDNQRILTATVRSTATWNPRVWANLRTTVGADYLNNESDFSHANGTTLPPGGQTVGSSTTKGASDQAPTATKTLGYYGQEQIALRDRLFLTAAFRYDQNTAFGTQYKGVPYPKFSASYNVSDESFFPRSDYLNSLHLRLAYGASGVQPNATSALRTFSTTTTNIVSDVTGLLASAIGNPNIKPETSAEWETGFDSRVWNNKVNIEFTYYSKQTKDALLNLNIAPSAGASAGSILKNLGSVKNAGAELSVNAQMIDRRNFAWDLTVGGSHNKNKLVTLGKDDGGKDLPRTGSTTRNQAGYPLNSIWTVPYTWKDANGDGLIGANEVIVSSTDTTYMGPSINTDQLTIQNGFDLLNRKLRITASFDNKGGGVIFNQYNFLCTQTQTCEAKSNPNAQLWDQARSVAANNGTVVNGTKFTTNMGYYENGQFWRFRELAATLSLPDRFMQRYFRAERASLTLGVRNLKVWTKYSGEDPESNYASGDTQNTLLTTAPRRYITARLNLNY